MNYEKYRLNINEWIFVIVSFVIIDAAIAYIFYDSLTSIWIFSPLFIVYFKVYRDKKLIRIKERIDDEFVKALNSISSSLSAGLSVENAFIEAAEDMERLFGDKSVIVKELRIINRRVESKEVLTDALNDFAKRSGSLAIEDFALVFSIANGYGGGFARIIQNCVDIIQNDRQIREEARILVRGKQYEQQVMSIIPIGIILYLRLSSKGFMSVLYHNFLGIIVMTICLIIYFLSIFISDRICNISV